MANLQIDCSSCGTAIELTEALASPLLTAEKEQHRRTLAKLNKDREQRELDLRAREQKLEKASEEVGQRVATELNAKLACEQQKHATVLAAKDLQLEQAEKLELSARKARLEAEETQRTLELQIQRGIDSALQQAQQKAYGEAKLDQQSVIADKDKLIADMRAQVDTLQRKSISQSQQMQGDLCEVRITTAITTRFVKDDISRIKTGSRGADILQGVRLPSGRAAGSILVEVKDTNTRQNQWLAKVREDQRAAEAEIDVLVSRSLLTGIKHFDSIDGVWVYNEKSLLPLLQSLRLGLLELARERLIAGVEQNTYSDTFQYLTGPSFKRWVSTMMEYYSTLRSELEKEKRALSHAWLKREKLLDSMLRAVDGVHGDLQGVVSTGLLGIEGLDGLDQLGLDN